MSGRGAAGGPGDGTLGDYSAVFIWNQLHRRFACPFRMGAETSAAGTHALTVESLDWSACSVHEVARFLRELGFRVYVNEGPTRRLLITGISHPGERR